MYQDRLKKMRQNFEADHRNASGQASARIEELDPNDKTLTFVIKKIDTDAVAGTVRLFGPAFGLDEQFNTDNNIVVSVEESSHSHVKLELLNLAYRLKGFKMKCDDAQQFNNPMRIIKKTASGSENKKLFQPANYESSRATNQNIIEAPEFQAVMTKETCIEFDFTAGTEVRIILQKKDVYRNENHLMGMSPIESARPDYRRS